jgi:uncharacterized protein (TIGR03083 family)
MDVARLVEGLYEHTAGFAKAVAGADPEARVPTCPDWPVRVLVGHIGQAHRWSAGNIRSGPSPVPDPFDAEPGADWTTWLMAGADDLVDAVRAAGDRPVWTFFGEAPATFWLRRMLHDTAVHHSDAALTTGAAFDVAPDVAADGISEWLWLASRPEIVTFRPSMAALRGTGQTVLLRADESWLVTRTPDEVRVTGEDGPADVTVTGTARELLLMLTRRLPLDQVAVTGRRDLIEHLLTHMPL